MANQQGPDPVGSFRAAIGVLAVAEGARLLKHRGSALGILAASADSSPSRNYALPVGVLSRNSSAAQTDQEPFKDQQMERA
jgi:hypothetical protein